MNFALIFARRRPDIKEKQINKNNNKKEHIIVTLYNKLLQFSKFWNDHA